MAYYLGIDIGTSAVKTILVDANENIVARAETAYGIERPHPLWAEQDARIWSHAVRHTVHMIRDAAPHALSATQGIGLSGQMHAAVVLDRDDQPLRPAMLWNDGRSKDEACWLHAHHPGLAEETGVLPMPGFTASKLVWLQRHEPDIFRKIRYVLPAKDLVRLELTGERLTDPCDGAGMGMLNEAKRQWSTTVLEAIGLDASVLPELVEGTQAAGQVSKQAAAEWGLPEGIVVAAGAGDCAAGAIGAGMTEEGAAFVSLGTGVLMFCPTCDYRPHIASLIHAFCHAVPERWFQMAAMLNGGSVLEYITTLTGSSPAQAAAALETHYRGPGNVTMLPYLNGERTPHNNPLAKGVLFGLTPQTNALDLAQAAMEAVAYTLADGLRCLEEAGTAIPGVALVGGGAKSRIWAHIIAAVMKRPVTRFSGGETGPAFGAARLARMAHTGESVQTVCTAPPVLDIVEPKLEHAEAYEERLAQFRRLYSALAAEFSLSPVS
ncbi:xylulokinase [Desulfovibrio inopinatus]|uniref:xylulokinase n=1 Tax=Desulfovibrio inopinatus TaxID=102109 RepID=UPI0003FD202F|nr:xylulokinase [Desulfovibrio inopinatus]